MAFIGQDQSRCFLGIAFAVAAPALTTRTWRSAITVAFILVAFCIGFASRSSVVSEDSATGIFFVTSMALGVIFLSLRHSYTSDVFNYLFGTILGVNSQDLWMILGLSVLVIFCILFNFKELYAFCFDEVYADTLGIPTNILHYMLLFLLALTIVLSVKVIGVILVTAFLVIPGACATQLTYRFTPMVLWAILIGVLTSLTGIFLSSIYITEQVELPPGPVVVTLQFLLFLVLLVVHRLRDRYRHA